jgi:hypothetical protein
MNKIKFCANILNDIKNEINKRNIIYDYGVDLSNYENEYTICLMKCLVFILNKDNIKDDIEWWLYEDVDKIMWINDKKYNVQNSYDFLKTIMYIV